MQKMAIIKGNEEIEGYEFLAFSIASEMIDGLIHQYPIVICKDENGYLEQIPVSEVRFLLA